MCEVAQSCPTLATPWTVAHQAPLSMGFSRQEYWSGLPFPSPGDLPNPGIEPGSRALQADALSSEPPGKPYNRVKIAYKQLKQNNNIVNQLCAVLSPSVMSNSFQPHGLYFKFKKRLHVKYIKNVYFEDVAKNSPYPLYTLHWLIKRYNSGHDFLNVSSTESPSSYISDKNENYRTS